LKLNRRLSVIVPVYRGGAYIRTNLIQFKKSLNRLVNEVIDDFEIIAVIDGYSDNSLEEAKKVKGIKIIGYPDNRGKGAALKTGFENSSGNIVTFIDGDGDFHPDQIRNFFPYLAAADMVVGSKRHPFSRIEYPFIRRFLSRGFQILSKIILGISLRDTQSGLKLFKRDVLEVILPLVLVKRWAFDLELCFLAQKHGFRTVEAPISIDFQHTSTVTMSVPYSMVLDMLAVRYRYSILKYYQKEYHRTHF